MEAVKGWPLDISETQGARRRWKVMSKNRHSRSGDWRKEADHYLTPESEGRQAAAGAAVIRETSSRHLIFLMHFSAKAGGRGEKGGKEE